MNKIKDNGIKAIMKDFKEGIKLTGNPEQDIKETLCKKDGKNILTFINFLDKKIKYKDVKNLINLIDNNQRKQIIDYWNILSEYQDLNKLFEEDFSKMIENSYIDYSLVSVYFNPHRRRKEFVEKKNACQNCEARYLLHGTQIDPICKILTNEFKYTRKIFYGMGVYFVDMIDYVSFFCGGDSFANRRALWNKIIPVGNTISCIASEVFYDRDRKCKIFEQKVVCFDHFPTYDEIKKDYESLMVEKNGINFIQVETDMVLLSNQMKILIMQKKQVNL